MEEEGEIAAFWENPSPTVGGFDFVFVRELSEDQKCHICLVAMRNPVQTSSVHRFCESCLLKSIGCVFGTVSHLDYWEHDGFRFQK